MDFKKHKHKDMYMYTTPPSNDFELKCVIIELLLKDLISLPIDSLSLFRVVKKMFKYVENSVYVFSRLEINSVVKEMVDMGCFDVEEVIITQRRCFYIRKLNQQNLYLYSQKITGSSSMIDYSSLVSYEKYQNKAKSLMLDSLINKPDRENIIKSKFSKDSCKFKNPTGVSANISKFSKYLNYNMKHTPETFTQEEDEDLNDIFFTPSAKMLLNGESGNNGEGGNSEGKVKSFNINTNSLLKPFCTYGTRADCLKKNKKRHVKCDFVHFKPVIKPHTDINLGDCSYLDTCRHMDICKFVHYEIEDYEAVPSNRKELVLSSSNGLPSQWINCDIRYFDLSILGKFQVIMADPPWDIHMELPYGTLSDEEMKNIKVSELQSEGVIFLWVTGRATELARECLDLWGYERKEELVWIKTNQLQRLIRTGRTGHWLNHSKEHCLIGFKGNPVLNRNVDCDVLVSEVRETSRKPDEIYELIERLCPKGRKVELFARPHNRRHGWVSLGNQLPGAHFVEDDVIDRFNQTYPDQKLTKEEMELNRVKSIETREIADSAVVDK